ncbi:sugar kinase [Lederbergia lenta]|uniref:Kinase, pfkB family n=1 Tax=Lederbergia lenta TaxID=1467 RepID=A0A2X4W9T8_LEDLE|nr:sugar kinase [Lederbergia lenta]MCM3109768.1 sugar kinase [Lederbergia lenta]MEC2324482.1 sugar kinase [Lederbergia lenta]SQI59793.1 kinase, pfkB family [Lederbergia lenta]
MDVISIGESMVLFTPETNGQMRYANQFTSRIAGAETNTLIGLAKLGHRVGWISQLGQDEFGASILSFVRGEGVDVTQVKKTTGAPTGIFFKEMINESDVQIYYYRQHSAASLMGPKDLNENYIKKSKYLYITGITPALSESCREMIFQSIKIAERNGVKIVLDPNIRRKLWSDDLAKKAIVSIAEKSNIVLPGIAEGEFLFDKRNEKEIAKSFHDLGAETVVVKLGENGAYYSTNEESGHVPALNIKRVVDPVGAGDGFATGFLSGILEQLPIQEAVARACAIGAIVATVNGDVEGLPDRAGLEKLMHTTNNEDVKR